MADYHSNKSVAITKILITGHETNKMLYETEAMQNIKPNNKNSNNKRENNLQVKFG